MINIGKALVSARKKSDSAKRFYVENRYFESGEDARECIRLCRSVRFSGHLASEATFLLACVNERLGFVP